MTPDVILTPVDTSGADRLALVELLTTNEFPFHVVPRPQRADVERRLASGSFDDEDHASFWLDAAPVGRLGLVVLEDLTDDAPLFDLRLATEHRGKGWGVRALRAITAHVFLTMPAVNRFEGQTREDNLAMRRTFRAAGFVQEAHYREGWPVADGAPLGSVAYAILRRDWETGTTTPVPWGEG